MRGVARIRGSAAQRVRRWDVVVVGAALPGLIAAVRLGQRGARVVVLEEEAAAAAPTLLREPFVLTGAHSSGVLGSCLRRLGVPLIDQRRFAPVDVAVQVALPDARVDFGRTALTAAELTAWGLAKPDEARGLVRALDQAARAEGAAMQADAERGARRRLRTSDPGDAESAAGLARGWPREASDVEPPLRQLLDALVRALSNLGAAPPSPEARARLVGGLLDGGALLGGGDASLLSMIRSRARALFAEFRCVDRPFELVSVANQPGLALRDPDEVISARVMVLNAPLAGLRRALRGEPPEILRGTEPTRRRVLRHLRGPAEVLPEGMEPRLVCVPAASGGPVPVVTLRRHPGERSGEVELIATAVGPADAPVAGMQQWIDQVLERLIPFADGRLTARPVPSPLWDTDWLLCDPGGGAGWPAPFSSRLPGRLPIHHLDRAAVAGLGFEGDLLLGLHAADAIAAELP